MLSVMLLMEKIEKALLSNDKYLFLQKLMIMFTFLETKFSILKFAEILIILICEYFSNENLAIFPLSGF